MKKLKNTKNKVVKFDFEKAKLDHQKLIQAPKSNLKNNHVLLRQPNGMEHPFEIGHAEGILQRQLRADPKNEREDLWVISPSSDYQFTGNRITLK